MPSKSPKANVKKLARAFSKRLRRVLTPAEMREVIERNKSAPPGVCASHDFCDANEVMADAFKDVYGRAVNPRRNVECGVWNDAWNLAFNQKFKVR